MSYYWFNRQELLQKAKDKCHNCGGKEKAVDYYVHKYKNLSDTEPWFRTAFLQCSLLSLSPAFSM